MNLQIVIPCFNEADGLKDLISQCLKVVRLSEHNIGFIIVDNGSTDNSWGVLNSFLGNCPNIVIARLEENAGYGGGILFGLKLGIAPTLGWTHADLQTPLIDCLTAMQKVDGERFFIKGIRTGRSLSDRFFSFCMGLFESVLFRSKLKEINAQPTIFDRKLYESWKNPPHDFSLDLYALITAKAEKFSVLRFSVNFFPRAFGSSKWNTGIHSRIKFIIRTLKYSVKLKRSLHENLSS